MSFFEALESRQLASASLNSELVVNGNAEAGLGALDGKTQVNIPGWTVRSGMAVIQYGAKGFLSQNDIGPDDRGRKFFSGGYVGPLGQVTPVPMMEQTIDVSNLAKQIDAGQIRFNFSAWLGGFGNERDYSQVDLDFKRADGSSKTVTIRGLTPGQRGGLSRLFRHTESGLLDSGVRSIRIMVLAYREFGLVADGYVDDISLKLTPIVQTDTVTGSVVNDLNGDGRKSSKESGLAGVTVFIDKNKNKNKKLDAGELSAKTDANGVYRIENVPDGFYEVRMIPPKGFRATTPASQVLTVKSGSTPTAAPFAVSKTALISGKVIWDDKTPFSFGVVYDDLDNDGKLDANEPSARTNEKGEFALIVRSGSHTIRADRVTGVKPLKVNAASGAFAQGKILEVPPQ